MMKIVLYLTLLLSLGTLKAQENKHIIKSSVGFGFAPDNLRTNVFEIEFQRRTILGVNLLAGFITSNGGISLDNLINENDYQNILVSLGQSRFQSTGGSPQGSFYNFSAFKIGVQKNIKLALNISIGVSISGLRASISETEIANFIYNEKNVLEVEELITKFATYSKFGTEVGIDIQHNLSSYVVAGFSIKYISINEFIVPEIFIGVNF